MLNSRPRDKSLGNPAARSALPGTGRTDFEMRVQRGFASLAGVWGQRTFRKAKLRSLPMANVRPHYESAGGTIIEINAVTMLCKKLKML